MRQGVSPSPHLLFFQFLIWSSSGRLASWQWKSGENNKVPIFTLKIFQFGIFKISTWCGFGIFKTFGRRWIVLIWLTSPIFMVIISWKHNRWIVGLFEGLIVVGWRFDIYNRRFDFYDRRFDIYNRQSARVSRRCSQSSGGKCGREIPTVRIILMQQLNGDNLIVMVMMKMV